MILLVRVLERTTADTLKRISAVLSIPLRLQASLRLVGIKQPPLTFVMAVVLSSGRQDSNLRSPAPKAGALTGLGHAPNAKAVANIRPFFLLQSFGLGI